MSGDPRTEAPTGRRGDPAGGDPRGVAIVGGGVTGLTTAWLLLRRGVPVTLYEASDREGGLAGSFERDGFVFDFGPHEFCTNNQELIDLLTEVCGDDLLVVRKRTAQHFRGRYVRYPFEIADVLRNVSPLLCARALAEVAWARLRNLVRPPADSSFRDWTCARYGRTLYESYFGPYTEKVWGIDPELLDPRTASQRITVDSVWDLLRRTLSYNLFGMEDFERTHSEFRRGFFYVRGGIGQLQRRLRAAVEHLGGRFEFGKRLAGMERRDGRVTALRFADGTSARGFGHVVSTIPLPLLVGMALGERGKQLAARHALPYRAMVFVFLRLARPQVLDYHWTYYPDRDVPFQRATEFVHFGAGMTPPGCTGLTLELACDRDDATWRRPDGELIGECMDSLRRLGLVEPGELLGADVVRVPFVYPLQVMGFIERAAALLTALGEVPNVVSIGRQGLFRYCNMNECMEMAIDVAPRIAAGETSIRCATATSWQGVGVTDTPDAVRAG